jgi:DNA-binding NtrC family response regulator
VVRPAKYPSFDLEMFDVAQNRKEPRIFVVDDETFVSASLARILRLQGFEARAFDKPFDALQAAVETPPDMLITDVMMPPISGIDLAIRIRELCPNCRVLLCSGRPATADLLAGARLTGHAFQILLKPVSPVDIIKKVRDEFQNWR